MGLGQIDFHARKTQAIVVGVVALLLGIGIFGLRASPQKPSGDVTGSLGKTEENLGPSGLPIPRFVTLKSHKVNVRRGPSSEYPVAWVYQRKFYPVEITAEFETWRRIRDVDGKEGWILQQMLSGKRYAVVAAGKTPHAVMFDDTDPSATLVAKLATGVLGQTEHCDGTWCSFTTGDYEGYVAQTQLWGVYPGEVVD
jgi:SH3-like domain-containing protein